MVAYSLGVALKPSKQTINKTEEEREVKVRLPSHFNRKLDDNIKNSPIACKETIAAVMAFTYEENTLRSLDGVPVYILKDNSVLVSLNN